MLKEKASSFYGRVVHANRPKRQLTNTDIASSARFDSLNEQAAEQINCDMNDWYDQFESWSDRWQRGIKDFSFENVRERVLDTCRQDQPSTPLKLNALNSQPTSVSKLTDYSEVSCTHFLSPESEAGVAGGIAGGTARGFTGESSDQFKTSNLHSYHSSRSSN